MDLVSSLRDEVQSLRTEIEHVKRGAVSPGAAPARPATTPAPDPTRTASQPMLRAPKPPSGVLPPNTYEIVFDGGSLGNPGKGYGSYILFTPDGGVRRQKLDYSDRGPRVTNNQAEYLTLIRSLEWLRENLGASAAEATVSIWGDSNLVVNQVNGTWKVKNVDLQPLVDQARAALKGFGAWSIKWHDRSKSVRLLGH